MEGCSNSRRQVLCMMPLKNLETAYGACVKSIHPSCVNCEQLCTGVGARVWRCTCGGGAEWEGC